MEIQDTDTTARNLQYCIILYSSKLHCILDDLFSSQNRHKRILDVDVTNQQTNAV